MKKIVLIILSVFSFATFSAKGQGYFAFYELRDVVPQAQILQPAFIPTNSVSVSLPFLNFGTSVQADYKLEELFSYNNQGQLTVDFDLLRASAQDDNHTNFDATTNLLNVGIKTRVGAFTLFGNTRATGNIIYGVELMEFLANGNSNHIGKTLDLSGTKFVLNGINEVGLGYANEFLDKKLTIGARVKMVQGVVHGSIGDDFQGTLHTRESDYLWTIGVKNGNINTAGLDYFFNSQDYESTDFLNYALSNKNRSVGFDIGAKYQILPWLKAEVAVNDIGNLKWSESVRNYTTEDAVVEYLGVDLANLSEADNIFRDSLGSKFDSRETQETFTTALGTRIYFTAIGNITPNDRFSLTYFKNNALKGIPANYALSYNHRFENFVVGAVGSYRRANNEVNIGASFASNIGPVQLYMALDNVLVANKPEQYSKADFRFGLNLMFGYEKWKQKDKIVDLDKL